MLDASRRWGDDAGRVPLLAFAIICFASAELGNLIVVATNGDALPAFWPATGVLVATLLLTDRRRWAFFVLAAGGTMILSLLLHRWPVLPSVAFATVASADGFLAAWLLRRVLIERFSLARVTHIWALVIAAALVPMLGAVLIASLPAFTRGVSFVAVWRGWWLMEALGLLLTTPVVVAAITDGPAFIRTARSWRTIETAAILVGAFAMAASVFGNVLDPLVRVPAYLLPFFLWPAFRLGPGSTAVTVLTVCVVGLWNTAHGHGPFALPGAPAAEWILRSQGTTAVAVVSFLLLAGVVAERKRITEENMLLVAELQQALAEIKTLRGFIPLCAWCHKVRDDAGFWQQIESYLDAKTDAKVSHSICPACSKAAHDEIATHSA